MKNPFRKLGELYAEHVMFPLLNNEKFLDVADKVTEINGKIYERTKVDIMGIENRDFDDNSNKSKLKKICKDALKSTILGVGIDTYNLNK